MLNNTTKITKGKEREREREAGERERGSERGEREREQKIIERARDGERENSICVLSYSSIIPPHHPKCIPVV